MGAFIGSHFIYKTININVADDRFIERFRHTKDLNKITCNQHKIGYRFQNLTMYV